MKKFALLLVILAVVLSTSVFSASVSRSFSSSRVSPGETVTVTITSTGVPVGEIYTVEDQAPAGWQVSNWNVQGAQGGREGVQYRAVAADNRHGWSFTAESSTVTVTYDARVPTTASNGDYKFDAVYFDSSGQGRSTAVVTVRTIACGDGVCEGSENTESCVADCPAPAPAPAPVEQAGGSTAAGEAAAEEGKAPTTTIAFAVLIVVLLAAFFLYTKSKKPGMGGAAGAAPKAAAPKKK